MNRLQHERNQGDEIFSELLSELKSYIHQEFLRNRMVPKVHCVLADVEHAGRALNEFLNDFVKPWAPGAVTRFIDRLNELLESAEYHYRGGKSA